MHLVGDVEGKDAIIVDDMIDTAGTLCAAGQTVLDAGARAVYAAATHPVLSGRAYDNLRHAAFVTPTLTTVHLPLYEVGALACERLIERAHGKTDRVAEKLPTHLMVRESTAMARTANGP